MVCKVEDNGKPRRQEPMKKTRNEQREVKKEPASLHCNKGSSCKFKRSCFCVEDDAISSAILLLACVFCSPNSM
ncbi:uncharacterized protein LOC110035503 [Phalaenopsis equestris]|uniref:uncharacterized protein LOC110035503 n=1 Tax=Phalaenopsis equestris TaxID=78828 RepID=UPI0009E5748C|nr:uncharacterized protein LOC110035503 [Phalaenopsis equestris]